VTDVFGQVVSYAYDPNSNRTQLSLNGATSATYQYDLLNRLTQLTDSASLNTTFGYDATNKLTSRTLPNGVVTTSQYDGLNRLTRLTHAKDANTVADFQYQFNAVNNITQMTDGAGAHNYSYDPLDRLTAATHPDQTNESYTFDDVGNRTASHQGSSYSYQPYNRLVSANSNSYGYDSNGNLISKTEVSGTWTYTWDYENRLKQASLSGGVTVNYNYDALGRRIQRTSTPGGSTRFVYDGADVLRDLDGNGSTIADYLNGPDIDDKLRQNANGTASYFVTDHLGTTRGFTDASGNLAASIGYDSFGNTDGSSSTRYTYTGREYDADTSLYYYRARFYDPQLGRFISEDPIGFEGGDVNLYDYVFDNPTNDSDESGLQGRAGPKGRGNYHPPSRVRCNPSQDCSTLAGNMAEIARAIASAHLLDQELGFPRHQPPHSTDIPDWQNAFMRCKRIYDMKCKDCGPPPSPVPVPNPVRARRPIGPGLDELRMQEESARQMEKFWTKVLIGDAAAGAVLLAPEGAGAAILRWFGFGARWVPAH
jgi:RHS repeat-associated protein